MAGDCTFPGLPKQGENRGTERPIQFLFELRDLFDRRGSLAWRRNLF
jgi:hypothetical protein